MDTCLYQEDEKQGMGHSRKDLEEGILVWDFDMIFESELRIAQKLLRKSILSQHEIWNEALMHIQS